MKTSGFCVPVQGILPETPPSSPIVTARVVRAGNGQHHCSSLSHSHYAPEPHSHHTPEPLSHHTPDSMTLPRFPEQEYKNGQYSSPCSQILLSFEYSMMPMFRHHPLFYKRMTLNAVRCITLMRLPAVTPEYSSHWLLSRSCFFVHLSLHLLLECSQAWRVWTKSCKGCPPL